MFSFVLFYFKILNGLNQFLSLLFIIIDVTVLGVLLQPCFRSNLLEILKQIGFQDHLH